MASPNYSLRYDPDEDVTYITIIFNDGKVQTITSKQPNYQALFTALFETKADEAEVRNLANPGLVAGQNLRALSERVRFDNGNIYFDGDLIDNSIAKHIVRIMEEGGNENKYGALVKFLEKLYTNPNRESIESLYDFLVRQNISILPSGNFLAYKGVKADGTSIHAGYGIVDGEVFTNAHLKNEIGSIIEIPRAKVDADTNRGCSTGLHAGSYNYAKGFAQGLLLTVEINPRDVVSVPKDCNFEKIRVARYIVLETTEQEITTTTYGEDADNDFEDDDEDERCFFCDEYVDDCACDDEADEVSVQQRDINEWRDENAGRDYIARPLNFAEAFLLENGEANGVILTRQESDAIKHRSKPITTPLEAWEIDLLTATETDGADEIVTLADWEIDLLLLDGNLSALRPEEREQVQAYIRRQVAAAPKNPGEAEFREQLQREIDGEEEIVLDFYYTPVSSLNTHLVTGFTPLEIETGRYGTLIKGQNREGQWRSYFYRFMEAITPREAGSAGGKHVA